MHYPGGVSGLIDSGWAAWLPVELADAYASLNTNSAGRRDFAQAARAPAPTPTPASAGSDSGWSARRGSTFPRSPRGSPARTASRSWSRSDWSKGPARAVEPEPVELVLTLDHEDVRELEHVRMARTLGEPASTPIEACPRWISDSAAPTWVGTTPARAAQARNTRTVTAGNSPAQRLRPIDERLAARPGRPRRLSTASTVPAWWATISFSIFIASTTTSTSPGDTSAPAATPTFSTVPCIGLGSRRGAAAAPVSARPAPPGAAAAACGPDARARPP